MYRPATCATGAASCCGQNTKASRQLASLYREAFVAPIGPDIVYEAPLLSFADGTGDGTVTAVMQSISMDGGASWSEPGITTQAFIYELKKSTLAQSFVGTVQRREQRP